MYPESLLEGFDHLPLDDGRIGPGTLAREIHQWKLVNLAGIGVAVSQQLGIEAILAGLAGHSQSVAAGRPAKHVYLEAYALLGCVFGDTEHYSALQRSAANRHRKVVGELGDGTAFSATELRYTQFVFASLLINCPLVYEAVVLAGRLTAEQLERYYQEMMPFAECFNIRPEDLPLSYAGLQVYYANAVEHDVVIGPTQISIMQNVLQDTIAGIPLSALERVIMLIAPATAARYGMPWSEESERQLTEALAATAALPKAEQLFVHAVQAEEARLDRTAA